MSSFLVDLWESIFVPGPTPTILIAANASFAALQLTLLILLVATHSYHFVILSFLCGGLWWSINWFSAELIAHQEREKAEAAAAAAAKDGPPAAPGSGDSDTEVEDQVVGAKVKPIASGLEAQAELKRRGVESQSSVSTEDEWEKVSESEKEKGK
jgi:hypothetical protein